MSNNTDWENDKSIWAVGGGVVLGLGVGFFFLRESPLVFVGCTLVGLGVGLIVTSILSVVKRGS